MKKSEFVHHKTDEIIQRPYVLIKTEKHKYPLCVYKIDDNKYSALLMRCSHKGCELNPQGDYLVCPCHGSEFTNTGIVQSPPAAQNLTTFPTTTDNENIYIHF
ncbi:MAG: Rieske (2Fe-2S) protein [Ignavibacteria bacterium]|nr:Rieske (2Fe-2S) protein [Ignavibacteria bacterium]